MDEFTRQTVETYRHDLVDDYLDREYEYAFAEAFEGFCDHVDDNTQSTPVVLDVGCGGGEGVSPMTARGYQVLGIDLVPEFLTAVRERTRRRAAVARMDMRSLALADDSIDALWSSASFYHVPREDASRTVAEFHRVLDSGAPVFCCVPNGEGSETMDDGRKMTLWPPSEFRDLFGNSGFSVDRIDAHGQWRFLFGTA